MLSRTHKNSTVIRAEKDKVCQVKVFDWLIDNCKGDVEIQPLEGDQYLSTEAYVLFERSEDANLFALRWL